MASCVYQRKSENGESISKPIDLYKIVDGSWRNNVPTTCIDLVKCDRTGSGMPKPKKSPQYKDYKCGEFEANVNKARDIGTVFLLVKYFSRLRPESEHEGNCL